MAYPRFEKMIREAYRKRGTRPIRHILDSQFGECPLNALSDGRSIFGYFPFPLPRYWRAGFIGGWDGGRPLDYGPTYDAGFRVGSEMARAFFGDCP